MPLPIVSGSEVHTPSSGGPMDATPFRNAALAKGQVGAALGDGVGDFFGKVANDIQQNRNARMVFDADLAMRKSKDDFTANLAKMPDEGTWLPAWKDQVDSVRQQVIDNPHAGPDVRRILSQKFDNWEQATSGEFKTAALLKGANETRKSAIAAATYAAQNGEVETPGGANDIMRAAVENHAFSPQEAAFHSRAFPVMEAESKGNLAITSDPIHAPQFITDKLQSKLPSLKFRTLLSVATEKMHAAQMNNLDEWSKDLDASPDHSLDMEAFAKERDNGDISQRGYDAILTRQKRMVAADKVAAQKEDHDEGLLLISDITDHDFVADKTPDQTLAKFREQINGITDPAMRNRITDRLNSRAEAGKKGAASDLRPVVQQQLDYMKKDFDDGSAFVPLTTGSPAVKRSFWFDKAAVEPMHIVGGLNAIEKLAAEDPKQFKKDFGDQTVDQIKEQARLSFAAKQKAFLDWAHDPANKDATTEEATAERQRIERPDAMSAAKKAIKPVAPSEIKGPEDVKGLTPDENGMVHFIYNGKAYTKKVK